MDARSGHPSLPSLWGWSLLWVWVVILALSPPARGEKESVPRPDLLRQAETRGPAGDPQAAHIAPTPALESPPAQPEPSSAGKAPEHTAADEPPWPVPFPERFEAVYDAFIEGVRMAELRVSLQPQEKGRYLYQARRQPTGLGSWVRSDVILERSLWRFHAGRIRPLHFTYDRSGGEHERHVEIKFDWRHGTVTNIVGNDKWRMDLPADTLDKLVYQLTLMQDLAAGRTRLRYSIADGGLLKTWSFTVVGNETIQLPLGQTPVVKLQRILDQPSGRSTTIWCAPDYAYLPVRVDHRKAKDGWLLSLRLRSVHGIPVPPSR